MQSECTGKDGWRLNIYASCTEEGAYERSNPAGKESFSSVEMGLQWQSWLRHT